MKTELLLRALDQAYSRKSWHGTTLRGSLRGVKADLAGKRPAPGRHSIAELAVHAAYWKHSVFRRITGEPRGSFPLTGSNWFERPESLDHAAWKEDLALLSAMHKKLITAVSSLPDAHLERVPTEGTTTYLDLILGVAAHDLYHAGQIQLTKKMLGF